MKYLDSFLLHHTTGTATVKSQNSSDYLILEDFPKCSNIHRFPRTALSLKRQEVKVLWCAVAPTKIPGTWALLRSALQDAEMPPGASDLFLAKPNSPSHQEPIGRTGVEKHQPSFWFHSPRPAEVPPFTPCLPFPAADPTVRSTSLAAC